MAQFSRYNAVDQLLDVDGSPRQANDRLLTDETGGLGSPVILNSGVAATITAFGSPNLTVGGLTGQGAGSVGTIISLRKAGIAGNNGTFVVNANTSASVDILTDASGYYPDPASGNLEWEQYNAGVAGTIAGVAAGIVDFTGGANFTANSVGHFITISGATTLANNGTFLITGYVSATEIYYANSNAVFPDLSSGSIGWVERLPYSLNDDLDFERSDRSYIKGVNYDQPVPSYTRPTLAGVNVPVNLANIAGMTLDAKALSVNRGQFNWPVEPTLTDIYSGSSALKHASATDNTGVPCFDAAPFTSDYNSCYVEVTNALTGDELEVQSGVHKGEKIFGITQGGTSSSPSSVEIDWYSAPNGADISTSSTAYTWEKGAATAKTGTTSVTVVPGPNGASVITGLTAGGFVTGDVGNWIVFSGFGDGNDGTFVIISVQGLTAITVQNHAAVAEGPIANVTWGEYLQTVPTFVDLTYGYNSRLDLMDQNALRAPLVTGLVSDADLRQDIIDIQSTGGWPDGTTNLSTLLTNTSSHFPFSYLTGGAGDTVVAALNVLNSQMGNDNFVGPQTIITSGNTITQSLQNLANAITGATVARYIERLAAAVNANTLHILPGGASYVLDGTNNGKGLMVFWRGLLRDPGSVANGDDYQETNTTHITPYATINKNYHINYCIL
jgi:hypothetical protein